MASDPVLVAAVNECMLSSSSPRDEVCDKASAILRKINDKVPARTLGKCRSCPHIIAIELACRCLGVIFFKEKLLAQTNVPAKDLLQALTNCKSILRLSFPRAAAIDILSVQFGVKLKSFALELLQDYRRLYVDHLDPLRQQLIDLSAAEYQTAAYYVVAKQRKVNVDKRKLLQATEVSSPLFHKIAAELEKVCVKGGQPEVAKVLKAAGSSVLDRGAQGGAGLLRQHEQKQKQEQEQEQHQQQQQPQRRRRVLPQQGGAADPMLHVENRQGKELPLSDVQDTALGVNMPEQAADVSQDPLRAELQAAAAAAAARRSVTLAANRKLIDSAHTRVAELKLEEKEKQRSAEAERQAQQEKRRLEERTSYDAWKARALKKRRA